MASQPKEGARTGILLALGYKGEHDTREFEKVIDPQTGKENLKLVKADIGHSGLGGGVGPLVGNFKKVEAEMGQFAQLSVDGEPGATLGIFAVLGAHRDRTLINTENETSRNVAQGIGAGLIAIASLKKSKATAILGPSTAHAGDKDPKNPSTPGFVSVTNFGLGLVSKITEEQPNFSRSSFNGAFIGGASAIASGPNKQAIAGILSAQGELLWGAMASSGPNGRGASAAHLSAAIANSGTYREEKSNGNIVQSSYSHSLGFILAMASGSNGFRLEGGPISISAE